MQTAIQVSGYYEGGQIILREQPLVQDKTEVTVYFLPRENAEDAPVDKERVFGRMKGQIWMSDDFDEPLEDLKEYM